MKHITLFLLMFSPLFSYTIELLDDTFQVKNKEGEVLKYPLKNEKFYIDKSEGKLTIKQNLLPKEAGIDIRYTITNPTSSYQPIPDFIVDGLALNEATQTGSINILNTLGFQYLHKRTFKDEQFLQYGFFDINNGDHPYPDVYSPVIVATDKTIAIGSSLNFNYQKDLLEPYMHVMPSKGGLWRYSYSHITNRELAPSQTLTLTLTLRFASPKAWLTTLEGYKKHFNTLYGANKNIVKKDLRPISGIILSYGSAAYENYLECKKKEKDCYKDFKTILKYNLFGFNYYIRPDLYGLDGPNSDHQNQKFVTTYIDKLKQSGYQRAMIWTTTGQYWHCPKKKIANNDGVIECTTNYPTQFMSSPVKKISQTLSAYKKFAQNGIDLGLWWGRSGQVPTPLIWNPRDVIPFEIENSQHVDFYLQELSKASYLGVKEIGLDAFSNMSVHSQLPWLVKMKRFSKMKFYNEGSVCDFLHTQTSAFVQPQNPWMSHGMGDIKDKAILMEYLNPGAEIIAYYPNSAPSKKKLQQLINWGYTPLLIADPNIYDKDLVDVHGLK